jgi:photosystem II stability/assembly factor-like uncharacterized protein
VVEVVSQNGLRAAARCRDGSVHQTGDGGRTWRFAGRLEARTLAFADSPTLYAVHAGSPDCAGLGVSRQPAHVWEPVGCVADATVADPVALSFVDAETGMLVNGKRTYVTSDGGRTWQRRDTPPPLRRIPVGL